MDRLTTGYVGYKYQTGNNNEWGDGRPRRAHARPGSARRRRRVKNPLAENKGEGEGGLDNAPLRFIDRNQSWS